MKSQSSTVMAKKTTKFPQVKITNKLSYSIDIYDVFNEEKKGQTVPYTYTKLATVAPGVTTSVQTIREASQLEATNSGVIKSLNNFYFDRFPIKVMAAVQFSFGNPPPLAFTVDSSDEQSMIQSFLFHRFAMANPNSALTKSLYGALKKGSVDDVNSFFTGTKNFKNCTLSSWNAILTWLQMNTSGWQGPYFLYEAAPKNPPSTYVPVLIATLNIESSATANTATLKLCSQDAKGNPVFSSPPQTTTVVMNGDGTMGDSNPGQDVAVSLTPVWMNVIQTSMKNGTPVSNYIVGPTVTGTVAGKQVVSSQTARQIPGKPAKKKQQSSFDASFGKICQSVGLLVGLLMLGDFASKMFKSAKEKINKAKEDANSESDFESQESTINSTPDSDVVSEASSQESTFDTDASEVSDSYSATSESLQEDVMTETMTDTMDSIQSEIQEQVQDGYTPTQDYEDAVSDLDNSFKDAQEKIENGDFSDASTELSDAAKNMDTAIENGKGEMAEWETNSLQESSDAVSDAANESDALDSAQEEHDNEMEDESNDSGFDSEDDDWPSSDEIPMEG